MNFTGICAQRHFQRAVAIIGLKCRKSTFLNDRLKQATLRWIIIYDEPYPDQVVPALSVAIWDRKVKTRLADVVKI